MRLVIDANVIFSALIRRAVTSDLLFSDKLELYTPEFLFTEIDKHRLEICSKSGLSKSRFEQALLLALSEVNIVRHELLKDFIIEAKQICPDPNDVFYFAVALMLDAAVWSNDKKLKDQNRVKVHSTKDLLDIFRGGA